MWAVLSHPDKRGNRWDLEAFLETGRTDARAVLQVLSDNFPDMPRNRALDFGCGVGRVTRALAGHFSSVIGVDVAPSMIRQARELAAGMDGLEYVLNERADLAFVAAGSVDLVYSVFVLQHIGQPYVARYLAEFVRVLSPKGLAVFQMPYERRSPLSRLTEPLVEALKHLRFGPHRMRMHTLPVAAVDAVVREAGGQVVRADESGAAGESCRSKLYFVRRSVTPA